MATSSLVLWSCAGKLQPGNSNTEKEIVKEFPAFTPVSIPSVEAKQNLNTNAQKTRDGKISNIKIVPFDSRTGEFGEEIKSNEDYINTLAISAFVMVEISGQAYFEEINEPAVYKYLKVEIIVMNGKRQIAKKIEQISLSDLSNGEKIFLPLWVDRLMCGDVKINARIIGQKTVSTMERTLVSDCQCTN